ncbi:MAG: hypothetical protein KA161_06650 [Saprospiraceae bacterium]|nr:hypothetical protein [Saprospiraceae bacterium]
MTEEEFYKEKIFNKVGKRQLKKMYPNLSNMIDQWYCSERYKEIQNRKSFLTNKIKQINDEGENLDFTNEQLYLFFQWWENTLKSCHYCSLPENELDNLHSQPGHINKRYPKRGKSLEIDRKQSDLPYTNIENLVFACYWCNNAKTDTFTESEFLKIGGVIKNIWESRLGRNI